MQFNVLIVAPSGVEPSHLHDDLALLLVHGLEDLGHEAILSRNHPEPGRINLLLGAQSMGQPADLPAMTPPDLDYVVIQTDRFVGADTPPGVHGPRLSSVYLPLLQGARGIWEVQPARLPRLEGLGFRPRRLSLGYQAELDRHPPREEPDFDFFFYGGVDIHRQALLQALADKGRGLEIGGYQDPFLRDESVSRAKVQLALGRQGDPPALTRIATLLNKGGLVVVEEGHDLDGLEDYVVQVPVHQWAEGCVGVLESPDRSERARAFHQAFKERGFSQLLAPLLTDLEGAA